jgi:hypothetical protein
LANRLCRECKNARQRARNATQYTKTD